MIMGPLGATCGAQRYWPGRSRAAACATVPAVSAGASGTDASIRRKAIDNMEWTIDRSRVVAYPYLPSVYREITPCRVGDRSA